MKGLKLNSSLRVRCSKQKDFQSVVPEVGPFEDDAMQMLPLVRLAILDDVETAPVCSMSMGWGWVTHAEVISLRESKERYPKPLASPKKR